MHMTKERTCTRYAINRLSQDSTFEGIDTRAPAALADLRFGALTGIEPRVGAMLPCNDILREVEGGVETSAIDPVASMLPVENVELTAVAGQVCNILAKAAGAIRGEPARLHSCGSGDPWNRPARHVAVRTIGIHRGTRTDGQ